MNTTNIKTNNIMTYDEVLRYLHISRCTLDRMIKAGKIRTFKVGNRYRFLMDDVKEYIANAYVEVEAQNEKKEDNRQHCAAQKQ